MKRAVTLLSFLLFPSLSTLFGDVVEHTYHFNAPEITWDSSGFHVLAVEGAVLAGRAGKPAIPFFAACLLLPPGQEAENFEIIRADENRLPGPYRLLPVQHVRPLSEGSPGGELLIDKKAYRLNRWYPEIMESSLSTHHSNGFPIASLCFTPVRYNPLLGEIRFFRSVTLRIHTRDASTPFARRALSLTPSLRVRLARLVDNAEVLKKYEKNKRSGPGDYEYLIITSSDLASAFSPLANVYTQRGIRTQIHTVEEIYAAEPGIDPPEQIRNRIIQEHQDHQIEYVLLGGDGDDEDPVVPCRDLYCKVESSSTYEGYIPADLYYSHLDGNWNGDGDGDWGEPGEEDFYAEVAVGRAVVESSDDVANFITKATRYQETPVAEDTRRALMLGEYLWPDPLTWGGPHMDELIGFCDHNGFTTKGIPDSYPIQKLYEMNGSWSGSDVIAEVNGGRALVNHLGHANWSYVMHLHQSDINDTHFTNDGITRAYSIFYTQGCYAGAFDYDVCIGEQMVLIEHCAVAFLGNSRYGWFTEGTTNGPSQHFHREFIDALFSESCTRIGAAQARSKDETVPFIDLPDEYEPGAHRWCFYTHNLLGDPAMDVWTDTPAALEVSHPPAILTGSQVFSVNVKLDGLNQAGVLVCLQKEGEIYATQFTNGEGNAGFPIESQSEGTLLLTATLHNAIPCTCECPVVEVLLEELGGSHVRGEPVAFKVKAPGRPNENLALLVNNARGSTSFPNLGITIPMELPGILLRYNSFGGGAVRDLNENGEITLVVKNPSDPSWAGTTLIWVAIAGRLSPLPNLSVSNPVEYLLE